MAENEWLMWCPCDKTAKQRPLIPSHLNPTDRRWLPHCFSLQWERGRGRSENTNKRIKSIEFYLFIFEHTCSNSVLSECFVTLMSKEVKAYSFFDQNSQTGQPQGSKRQQLKFNWAARVSKACTAKPTNEFMAGGCPVGREINLHISGVNHVNILRKPWMLPWRGLLDSSLEGNLISQQQAAFLHAATWRRVNT